VFAAVWKLYARWLNSTGRFVNGLNEAAKSVLANEFAQQAAYNHLWGFNGALWDRKRCGYVAEIATLRAALKAQNALS